MADQANKQTLQSTVSASTAVLEVPFGATAIRLEMKHWLAVFALGAAFALMAPAVWTSLERFETEEDYRLPYELSKDYWLYSRRLNELPRADQVLVVGDSVVWGEYVSADGTLSHFLNTSTQGFPPFVNAGVNGLFPLALEGLIRHHGKAIRRRKVLLHCNLLWLSSPTADLSIRKEHKFNHPKLVAQFSPRIPCYRASLEDRLGIVASHHLEILGWVDHLRNAYFEQDDLYGWTLADNGQYPPSYLNSYRNPIRRLSMRVPSEPASDPNRGIHSPRHKPWSTTGVGTQQFDWVEPDASLQWSSFKRIVRLLLSRENELIVVMGPFNEHIMASENREIFKKIKQAATAQLKAFEVPIAAPNPLASQLYGHASHPLTEGYQRLAEQLVADSTFRRWLDTDDSN